VRRGETVYGEGDSECDGDECELFREEPSNQVLVY